jgi:hypothetical protein
MIGCIYKYERYGKIIWEKEGNKDKKGIKEKMNGLPRCL